MDFKMLTREHYQSAAEQAELEWLGRIQCYIVKINVLGRVYTKWLSVRKLFELMNHKCVLSIELIRPSGYRY